MTLSLFISTYVTSKKTYAVIISKKVSAHSGPSENLPTLFYIHGGHELQVISKNKNWVEIQLKNGFKGWVSVSALEII